MTRLELANGYYDLPAGKLVNLVTCLEMTVKPQQALQSLPAGFTLQKVAADDLSRYRQIFRAIGQNIMWFSRLIMDDAKLTGILQHPAIHSFYVTGPAGPIGLLELDFREAPHCELAFFGLVPAAIGQGLGRQLMDEALRLAWAQPIARLWLHTCHFDHPKALSFYQRCGFHISKLMIEVHDDPRLQGFLATNASPHVPLWDVSSPCPR